MHKLYTLWLELDASRLSATIHHRYTPSSSHCRFRDFRSPSHFVFSLTVNQQCMMKGSSPTTPTPSQSKPKSSPKRVKFKISCKLPEAVSAANEIQYNPIGLALLSLSLEFFFISCTVFHTEYPHLLPCILLLTFK